MFTLDVSVSPKEKELVNSPTKLPHSDLKGGGGGGS